MTLPNDVDLDLDEHRALVEGLPARLHALVAAGALTPEEARNCLRRANDVLTARLARDADRP